MATNYSEERLIAKLKRGDISSYSQFINTYKNLVYSLCLKMLCNKEEAEEVAQDSFLKAIKSIKNFKGKSKLSTWLYSIVYRNCLDRLKSKNYKQKSILIDDCYDITDEGALNALDRLEKKEINITVTNCLAQLDTADRFLLTLFYFEELPLIEIGEIMKISSNNVKVKLYRARKKLADIFKHSLPPETILKYERA